MRERTWLIAVIGLLAATGLHVWHYRGYLLDDAYILFRYAENAARGWGLVFNHGDRVEGYTSFLWVAFLWLCHRLGVEPTVAAAWVGRAAALGIVLEVARQSGRRPLAAALVAPVFLACNRSFAAGANNGMETHAFTLAVILALGREGASCWGYALVASLLRPEGAGLIVLLYALRPRLRRGVFIALVPLAIHWVWRISYYGDFLPNTFWAKVPGFYLDRGLSYLLTFAQEYRLALLLPLLLMGAVAMRTTALLWFLLLYVGYVCLVGGDLMEFRFMVPTLPLLGLLAHRGTVSLTRRLPGPTVRAVVSVGALGVVLVSQLPSTGGFVPRDGIPSLEQLVGSTRRWVSVGSWLHRHARPDEILATTAAGAIPYYSELPAVDMHGLCDRAVARLPLVRRGRVGHERLADREHLCGRGVVYLLGHPDLRRHPSDAPDTISVQVRRRWLQFTTCLPPDSLRNTLTRRGAVVWRPDVVHSREP
jgi:hypothetical protein